jgi:Spy/CpxP family protein refolding chaperone
MLKHQLQPLVFIALVTVVSALSLEAQQPGRGPNRGWETGSDQAAPLNAPGRPRMGRALQAGPPGRWWTNPAMVQKLGLTTEQQKQIDAVFQQNRVKLIDLNASVQKEEAVLDPMLDADRPDESKVLVQIDRIAQARAELEKANARMLLGFRGVLNPDQWKKLQTDGPPGPPRGGQR